MSTRYVWERYSRKSSYHLYRQDIEYSPINDICVVDTRGGYFLFMKSAPTVVSTNKLKYSGSYRMVDAGNLQGQKVSSSAYPYATFVWADNPDEYSDAGMPRSPSAGNTYSGDITLNSAGVWADNTIYKAADNGYWGGRVYSDSGYWVSISLGSSATYPGTSSYEIEEWRTTTDYSQGSTDYGPVSGAGSGDYPQNSYSGSYWYVYQGSDTIDPAAVTLPAGIFGGDTVTVTVTPSAGKVYGGNVTYTWLYRLDGGAWQSLGSGAGTTQSLTVPAGTNTVEVQVRANDDLGFTSSTWVSSGAVNVTNNLAPTAPGSITVSAAVAGEPVTVTLTAASDPDGTVAAYRIERRVDGGSWQQVSSGPGLTYTDTVGADWQSVQYRAAAIDNEGAQGPYIESEVLSVSTGAVTITGPASGQGEHAQPFDIPLTLGVTPAHSDPAVQFAVLLDGAEAVSASHQSGDQITLHIDPRVMARGAHTITVTASKEAYSTAMAQYTYTVPAWDGSDIAGGKSGRFEDHLGNKLLPKTLAQDSLGPGGADMATLIAEAQAAAAAAPLEPVVKAAPPSGSYALSPGVLYDFTQADATALTFTFEAPESGKAAAYHVMFKCGSTAATVTLPEGVKTPDGYVIEAGRVYELSILQNMLAYMSWGAD